jgi:hypothetical protein
VALLDNARGRELLGRLGDEVEEESEKGLKGGTLMGVGVTNNESSERDHVSDGVTKDAGQTISNAGGTGTITGDDVA